MKDKYDIGYILFMFVVIGMFLLGMVLGQNWARADIAYDVCVTYGCDTGRYTQGEIVCGYDYAVPDELAPILGGE